MENWMVIILAIVAVLIIGVLLRYVFKIGIALLIIGLVVFFASGYSVDDLVHFGKEKAEEVVIETLKSEVESAEFTKKDEGEYEFKTDSLTGAANLNAGVVDVEFKGEKHSFSLNDSGIGEYIRTLIETNLEKVNKP